MGKAHTLFEQRFSSLRLPVNLMDGWGGLGWEVVVGCGVNISLDKNKKNHRSLHLLSLSPPPLKNHKRSLYL